MHFFQLELYTNVKMFYSMQWFENVQMHLHVFVNFISYSANSCHK